MTQEKDTKGPTRFNTTNLRLSNLIANITVEVWDQSGMEITMTGPKSGLEAIIAQADSSTLSIDGKDMKDSASGISVQSRRGGSVISVSNSFMGGMVIMSSSVTMINDRNISSSDAIIIMVKVPKRASITLDCTDGNVTIGDVDGNLNVSVQGGGEIRSGRMSGATISIMGGTDVYLSEVNGPLTAKIMGSGDVKVKSGSVTALNVQIMGSGDFKFDGVADTAMLSVMGTGDITVKKVKSKPVKQRMGTGDIEVG